MKENVMIGDWVQIVSDAPIMPDEYHRIDWIRTGEVGLDNRKIVTYPYIQPIPLTSEILEKNGFEWNTYHTSQDLVFGTIHIGYGFYKNCISASDWDENGNLQIVSLKCEYVHELQHVLRLCGIEKEIEP